MLGFLSLGVLIGMAHALEADHLAAVGTMAEKGRSSHRRLAWLGASWGLGHTTTLMLLSLPVLFLGWVLSERMEAGLEFSVGIMLVVLGGLVFSKMRRDKVHFHLHEHADGSRHFHAHSHRNARHPHREDRHEHRHEHLFSRRSYVVGLVHGAAGSAGLAALAAAASQDLAVTFAYVALFGIGSTLGMALLTMMASWPLRRASAGAGNAFAILRGSMACLAIAVGLNVMAMSGPVMMGTG